MATKVLIYLFLVVILGFGCLGKKKAEKPTYSGNLSETFCSISFFSIGYGIDVQGLKSVQNWAAQKSDSLVLRQTPWGREGEVDLCLQTRYMEEDTRRWVNELKGILANVKNCRISLEKECRK
jgi:hypothetical protein